MFLEKGARKSDSAFLQPELGDLFHQETQDLQRAINVLKFPFGKGLTIFRDALVNCLARCLNPLWKFERIHFHQRIFVDVLPCYVRHTALASPAKYYAAMAKGKLLEITAKVSIITDPFTVSLADAGSSVDLDCLQAAILGRLVVFPSSGSFSGKLSPVRLI